MFPLIPKCKHVCKTVAKQPVYTRKYRKEAKKKSIPQSKSLWSKSRRLLGCKGNWWVNLAPPRSPDFSFVTDSLFRNILHLHTNPIFFLKRFFDFCQTEILGSLWKMTLLPRLHSGEHPVDASWHGECAERYSWDLMPKGETISQAQSWLDLLLPGPS